MAPVAVVLGGEQLERVAALDPVKHDAGGLVLVDRGSLRLWTGWRLLPGRLRPRRRPDEQQRDSGRALHRRTSSGSKLNTRVPELKSTSSRTAELSSLAGTVTSRSIGSK